MRFSEGMILSVMLVCDFRKGDASVRFEEGMILSVMLVCDFRKG